MNITPRNNELLVVTKAKDLCTYIVTITQKSPKQYRFTFVSRLQNLSLDVIEKIYYANEIFLVKGDKQGINQRLALQHAALTTLKLIVFVSELSMRNNCILLKHYEQISKLAIDCQNLLGGWINSDKKRFIMNPIS